MFFSFFQISCWFCALLNNDIRSKRHQLPNHLLDPYKSSVISTSQLLSFRFFSWALAISFRLTHHSLTSCAFKIRFSKPGMCIVHVHLHASTFEYPAHSSKEKQCYSNVNRIQILQRKLNDLFKCLTKKPHTASFWWISCGSAFFLFFFFKSSAWRILTWKQKQII